MKELFQDPAIRFGLKLGIAGLAATYLALVMRLEEPTWALFTIFVLMVTPYVGSIIEKSVLRIFGTIIGASLGYLLLDLQQQPFILLPLVGIILAFCVAMFGQSLWSYGFFLCGLTLIDVMQAGLGDPGMSWRFALARAEEVVLGIMVALVVQSVLWPRYAREEFEKQRKETLADLQTCLAASLKALFSGGDATVVEHARQFPTRIAKMRALINTGSKENRHFRTWAPVFSEIVYCLNRMALSIVSLSKPLAASENWPEELRSRMKHLGTYQGEALLALIAHGEDEMQRRPSVSHAEAALQELEIYLEDLKKQGGFQKESPDAMLSLGHHLLALKEIEEEIALIHNHLALISAGDSKAIKQSSPHRLTMPSHFWIHLGIKGALAVIIALLLEDWLWPPGGTLLAISTWILLVRGPTAPAGRGDWRAFHEAIIGILAWLLLGVILLIIHPFLASYAVMNIVLFTLLFLWGYLFYGRSPMTTPMLVGMLMIVGVFGLNCQAPVSFQDIADLFLGMVLAIILSSLIRRLLWPSLPQREISHRLLELSKLCRSILSKGGTRISSAEHARLALIPGETSTRLNLLDWPVLTPENKNSLKEYLQLLHRGTLVLSVVAGRIPALAAAHQQNSTLSQAASLEEDFRNHLLIHEDQITGTRTFASAIEPFEKTLQDWKTAIATLCRETPAQFSAMEWLSLLGFCKRLEEAGNALLQAGKASSQLDWAALTSDSSL